VRTDQPRQIAGLLLSSAAVMGLRLEDERTVLVDTNDVQRFRRTVAAAARHADARLLEVVPLDDDLDSVFRYLVGQP